MPARLVPLIPGSAPVVPLQRPVLLVGRHPECDIRFDLPAISRRHCCLALAYDRITIRDLGSRHGIQVNGEVQEEFRLHPGDEIAIGPLLFRLEDEAVPPPKPVAVPQSKPRPLSLSDLPANADVELEPLSALFPEL